MCAAHRRRISRRTFAALLLVVLALAAWLLGTPGFDARDWPRFVTWSWSLRRVDRVAAYDDVRWVDLRHLDLRQAPGNLLPTLGFNRRTRWPSAERLPPGFDPESELTRAMNPGLGVRALHRQGITGRGVHVALIDFNVVGHHPEYASQLASVRRLPGVQAHHGSMHGPAVLSLLAGRQCGVAPEARVHLFATTDPGGDAAEHAQAIDWVLQANRQLPASERIRVISISAAPSGRSVYRYRNGDAYDRAFDRAEAAGVLVIDGTEHHGFVGPCTLDLADPEDPARCSPVPARGEPGYFAGRVLCPTSPRTTAEEFGPRVAGYQHCGLQRETHGAAGSSWSMPYAAGVAALAWQIRPDLSPQQMREALRTTSCRLPAGELIINPPALIDHIRRTVTVPADPSPRTSSPN
ncbi:MAG: S8 family serine peptidase [Limisphaerales bacterium]